MEEFNEKELDEQIVKRLQYKIFAMERENHKIQKYSSPEMVQRIRKLIDEVVREDKR